jgi:hypothetical protein
MQNQLVPIFAPWKISPSISAFAVTMEEDGDTTVTVNVYTLSKEITLDGECVDFSLLRGDTRVVLTFELGLWVRTSLAYSDSKPLPPGLFNIDAQSPIVNLHGFSPLEDEYWVQHKRLWINTDLCPDPGVYTVENSSWLEETGASRWSCKHYVLEGREMWMEIIGRNLTWVEL